MLFFFLLRMDIRQEKGYREAMLTINPVKSIQGKIDLPPSPDLFFLAAITAIAARQVTVISPVNKTPLIESWLDTLKKLAEFQFESDTCTVKPLIGDQAASFLLINYDELPYKDIIIYILLGLGKTVAFRSISSKRVNSICETLKRYHATAEENVFDGNPGLTLSKQPSLHEAFKPEESDISPMVGLFIGAGGSFTVQTTFSFSNPMRQIAPIFNFEINLKNSIARETDPISKRIRMMQASSKNQSPQGQRFILSCNFTNPVNSEQPVCITLPGDEILSTVLLTAKCLFPKGSFVINNMPLETWGTPALGFIRKMGCKISVQETNRTSFGSAGMFSIQKCELVGRKVFCSPSSIYTGHLPSMVVLAAFAKGQSVFRNLQDLRNDEPDGIDLLESCIRTLGARHGEMPDGIVMDGGHDFDGFDLKGNIPAHIAGSFAIAGLKCIGVTTIEDESLSKRWPSFESILSQLCELRVPQGDAKN